MPSEIRTKSIARATFTITLGSLASGSARQSTRVDNSSTNYPAAQVYCQIKSGTAPTAGQFYEVFLWRYDGTSISDDNAGASDAAITIVNMDLLGAIVVTASANTTFYKSFRTDHLGPLGAYWGIAIRNSTGQALNATGGDHVVAYRYLVPEAQ